MLNIEAIKYQAKLIKAIRYFFNENNFEEVLTPPMVENPGMETHIHPFEVFSAKTKESSSLYLQTSPEFNLKEVLARSSDLQNIYSLSYCFRDEPSSPIHRNQFLMLEWYRKFERYEKIMEDCEYLVKHTAQALEMAAPSSYQRVTISDLFQDYLKFNILDFSDKNELKTKIEKDFPSVSLPFEECSWDDYFFLLFLNEIEPKLKKFPYLCLYEYPAPLAALSTLKSDDPRVCERFEIYMGGIEIANCFNELTDYQVQLARFQFQAKEKKDLYHYSLPEPTNFLQVIEEGYPKSAGIALGFERLLQALTKLQNPFFR